MYRAKKKFKIEIAHRLKDLKYVSQEKKFHGHTLEITFFAEARILQKGGTLINWRKIREKIRNYDKKNLSRYFKNPTLENIAESFSKLDTKIYRVQVSSGNDLFEFTKKDFWD